MRPTAPPPCKTDRAYVLRGLVGLLVLLLGMPVAQAAKKGAFLSFTGKGASRLQGQLESEVTAGGRVTLVDGSKLESTATELGIDPARMRIDPTLLSQAASAAQIDAVVKGKVFGKGRSAKLIVQVYDGGTGNQLRRLSVGLKRGRLPSKDVEKTARRIALAIEGGQWMGPLSPTLPPMAAGTPPGLAPAAVPPMAAPTLPGLPEEPTPPVEPPPVAYEPPPAALHAEPVAPPLPPEDPFALPPSYEEPAYAAGTDYGAPAYAEDPGPVPPQDGQYVEYEDPYGYAPAPAAPAGRPEAFSLLAGPTFFSREFELDGVRLADGRPGTVAYSSGFFPGVWADAALFPLQLTGRKDWLAGFGLRGSFSLGFLKSRIQEQVDKDGRTEAVDRTEDTTQNQLTASLAYRRLAFPMGSGYAAVEVDVGYSRSTFALQTGTPGYKSNTTSSLRTAASLDLPLASSGSLQFAMNLGGAFAIGSTTLNDSSRYPASGAKTFELRAGARMILGSSLVFDVTGLYQNCTTDYEAVGAEPTATGTDRYLGALLMLGYRG